MPSKEQIERWTNEKRMEKIRKLVFELSAFDRESITAAAFDLLVYSPNPRAEAYAMKRTAIGLLGAYEIAKDDPQMMRSVQSNTGAVEPLVRETKPDDEAA